MVQGLGTRHLGRWIGRVVAVLVIAMAVTVATVQPAEAADPATPPVGHGLPAADPDPGSGAGSGADEQRAAPDGGAPAAGSTPAWPGQLSLPSPTPAPGATATEDGLGPLGREIIDAQNEAERLGEQLKGVADELTRAAAAAAPVRIAWESAAARRQRVAGIADAHDATGAELVRAEREEAAARESLDAHEAVLAEISGRYAVVSEQFQRSQNAVGVLRTRNADLLAQLDRERDAYEASLAASRGAGLSVNGLRSAPAALAAVAFAVSQEGKPYEWAAEGPYSYDCSGLVLSAYRSVGVGLPRVAKDQYHYRAGVKVSPGQLLPGDLLFFSTDPADAGKIHHVAMYLGNGRMVHAPTFGEKVKEAPVWWTEYFGALRVVPAVPAGTGPTTPAPSDGQPTPTPSATPSVSASASAGPDATPSPTPGPDPTPDPTPTLTPDPTPDPTGSPSPSPLADAPASPSQTPAPTLSEGPTPTPTPAPQPDPSPTSSPPVPPATTAGAPLAVTSARRVRTRTARRGDSRARRLAEPVD